MENLETVFKLLGTQTQPTEQRESLLSLILTYINACQKINKFKQVEQEIENLFKAYPDLSSFFLQLGRHDNKYFIENLSIYMQGNIDETREQNVHEYIDYALGSEDIILSHLLRDAYNNSLLITIDNFRDIFSAPLNLQESEVYEGIENFEKNLLNQTIATTTKYKTPKL